MNIENLIKEMTLDEKIGQCVQLPGNYFDKNGELTGPLEGYELTDDQIFMCGSTLGISGSAEIRKAQSFYLEKSRLKIPLLFMADVVHGYETMFPIPLAIACSFDPMQARKVAEYSAIESYSNGLHVTFSPMVDIVKDARWGRVMESNGEDTKLGVDFAKAYVEGYQGTSLDQKNTIASCVKHFVGYGAAEAGREYNTVDMSERVLRQEYLQPFQSAIDAGCKLLMTSFNTVNSVPASVNKWLLTQLLRDEMGFEGLIISDWTSIKECIAHGVCSDLADAGVQAFDAGCDIEMSSPCYYEGVKKAIEEGVISIEALDRAVLKVLSLKQELGLFENPYRGCDEPNKVLSDEHKQAALEVAQQSIVLLKNEDSILPIDKSKSIAIVGPNCSELDLNGSWTWKGHLDNNITLQQALQDYNVVFCGNVYTYRDIEHAEIVIYAGGEKSNMVGEAASRASITLPFNQEHEIEELANRNKQIVFVNYSGRPIDLSNIINKTSAIVQAWFLGTMTNQAVASVLSGDVNPSGKLAMSFPASGGQCPIYYNHLRTGRPYQKLNEPYKSRYMDIDNEPLFPFGHGLNYSNIQISQIEHGEKISVDATLKISINLENSSNVTGTEVVQVYINDKVATVARPVKELVAYQKVEIAANNVEHIDFEICLDDIKYVGLDNKQCIESGDLTLMIGLDSAHVYSANINVIV